MRGLTTSVALYLFSTICQVVVGYHNPLLYPRAPSFDEYVAPLMNGSSGAHSASTLSQLLDPLSAFGLEKRQTFECEAGPGGPICSATTCCAAGRRCCYNGGAPVSCCMTSETCYDAGRRCCPSDGETCGGTTCCQPGAICCPSSSSGCCIGGAVCCRSSTNPCCPGGSTCCGDTCCREGETCSAGGCINEEFIRTNRVVRFAYDELRNGALLRNMCRATRFMNTVTLEYAKAENAIQKSEIRRTAFIGGCRDGFCGAVTERGTCNEFPPAMTDEAVQGVWPISRQVISCIPQNQNTYQGAVFNNMIRRSEIVQGQGFALAMDCDGVRTALDDGIGADEGSLTETRENGVSGELNEYPPLEFFDQTTGLIVVGFGDLGPGSYSAEVTIDEGSAEIAYIVDNLGDELAAVADRLRAGDTQTLTWEVSPDGELMGVGLVIPTLVNGTKVSWKFQETGPPSTTGTRGRGSQTTIRGGSSTGSPDDFFTGGAFQMVVNREFWKGVVGMAALGVVLVWI